MVLAIPFGFCGLHCEAFQAVQYLMLLAFFGFPDLYGAIATTNTHISVTCYICGCEGKRKTQGLFICPHCGEYNADLNGAINLAKNWRGG